MVVVIDAVSAIAALVALTEVAFKSARTCRKAIKNWHNADEDMHRFKETLSNMHDVVDMLTGSIQQMHDLQMDFLREKSVIRAIGTTVRSVEVTQRSISTMCMDIRKYTNKITRGSTIKGSVARIRWVVFQRKRVKILVGQLTPTKYDICLLTHLLVLKQALHEAARTKSLCRCVPDQCHCVPQNLLEKIKSLKRKNKEARAQRDQALKAYQDLQTKYNAVLTNDDRAVEKEMQRMSRKMDKMLEQTSHRARDLVPEASRRASSRGSRRTEISRELERETQVMIVGSRSDEHDTTSLRSVQRSSEQHTAPVPESAEGITTIGVPVAEITSHRGYGSAFDLPRTDPQGEIVQVNEDIAPSLFDQRISRDSRWIVRDRNDGHAPTVEWDVPREDRGSPDAEDVSGHSEDRDI